MTKQHFTVSDDKSTQFDGYATLVDNKFDAKEPFTYTITDNKNGRQVIVDGDFDDEGDFILSATASGFNMNKGAHTYCNISRLMRVDVYHNDVCEIHAWEHQYEDVFTELITKAKKTKDLTLIGLAKRKLADYEKFAGKELYGKARTKLLERFEKAEEFILAKLQGKK